MHKTAVKTICQLAKTVQASVAPMVGLIFGGSVPLPGHQTPTRLQCTISILFCLLKTCWYGSFFFVTAMIFVLFVLIFNPHFWLSSDRRPVSSSILSMHSAIRTVSSAYSTSNSWSGIFLHSSLILRFSCLRIQSSMTLKSVGNKIHPCLKPVW